MLCGDSVKLSQCSVVGNIVDFKDILWRQIFVLGVDVKVFLPGYFQQFGVGGCSSQFEYKTQVSYGRYFQKVFSVRHFSHRKRIVGPWEVSLVSIRRIFEHWRVQTDTGSDLRSFPSIRCEAGAVS